MVSASDYKPTIRENVERVLAVLDVHGVEFFDESRPDRCFCWDMLGQLIRHCRDHPEHWLKDEIDTLHGASTRENYRERVRPSMQVVEHAISQINHPDLPATKFYEIDFDLAAPTNPATLAIHLGECIVHAIRHSTTDQSDISRRLDARLKPPKETTA